jgi:hypothetical protein
MTVHNECWWCISVKADGKVIVRLLMHINSMGKMEGSAISITISW